MSATTAGLNFAHWLRAHLPVSTREIQGITRLLKAHKPLVDARDPEMARIKARILANIEAKRLESCRLELAVKSDEPARELIPFPLSNPTNTMTPPTELPPIQEPEIEPGYSPRPDSEAALWVDDTEPSPSSSPSLNPGP